MTDVITFTLTMSIKAKTPITRPYRVIEAALMNKMIDEIGESDERASTNEFHLFGREHDVVAEWSMEHTKDVDNA